MKIPKKIQILNMTFEIKRDKRVLGHFIFKDKRNHNKPTIYLINNNDRVLEPFIHETLEIVLELVRARYERGDEADNYVFYYSHKEHDLVAKVMSQVVQQLLDYNSK